MKTSPRILSVGGAIFGAAALLATVATTQAALIAYEGFDIAPGSIQGLSGATSTGFTNTWNNTDNVWSASAAGLSYGPLVTSTGGGFSSGQGNQQTFREFAPQTSGSLAGPATYWLGFLFNRTSGSASSSLGLSFFNGGSENTFVGQAGNPQFGFAAFFGNLNPTTVDVVSGDTVFLLARYVMDGDTANANSVATYWINPDISDAVVGDPSDFDAIGTVNFRAFGFDRIRLGSFGSQGTFDEIRIGTEFRDVAPIPEPASAMLLGAGLLTLAVRRRRA